MPQNAVKCSDCGLVFERLSWATNSAGKKMIKQGKKDKVVYVTTFPSDLKRYKVLLMCIFLGLFGGHCFYVGRQIRGVFMLIGGMFFIVGGTLAVLSVMPQAISSIVSIIVGSLGFVWIFDVVNICIKKFKVPVYIDFSEEK